MAQLGSSLAPMTSKRPVPRPENLTGQALSGQAGGGWKGMMQNPMMQAFLLNMAQGLLSQQGIAQSMSMGLGGMGRYLGAKPQADMAVEAHKMQMAKNQAALTASGKKGSGSGTSTKFDSKFWKSVKDYASDLTDQGLSFEEAQGMAVAMAMRDMGNAGPYNAAFGIQDPAARTSFLQRMGSGPQAWDQLLKDAEGAGGGDGETPPKGDGSPDPGITQKRGGPKVQQPGQVQGPPVANAGLPTAATPRTVPPMNVPPVNGMLDITSPDNPNYDAEMADQLKFLLGQ